MIPLRSSNIEDENGNLCKSGSLVQERWRRHFSNILNIESAFEVDEITKLQQRPVKEELANPPSRQEIWEAVGKMKNGKAGGESGILPEMLKAICDEKEILEMLLSLIHQVWEECRVPSDWCNAVLIPVPKKGNLKKCDNWRGIALLDVVGKMVARILQERLQRLAEDVLPESQCGFRKGRGCMDMIFTIRQLVEKSWEHNSKCYYSFVDLKKAYDSVPREALWMILQKFGVPGSIIRLVRSFHQGMSAKIRIEGSLLEQINVNNGLRQGCCLSPVLFNLFSCAVLEHWKQKLNGVDGVGVHLCYKYDQKLFRRYIKNASHCLLSDCLFADDGALLASSRAGMELSIKEYQSTCSSFGLTVSAPKTKHMVSGRMTVESDRESISVDGGDLCCVEEFPYLGSLIAASGRMDVDVERRIIRASQAFGALKKSVFRDKNLTLNTKRKVYQACVLSILLYGAECWIPLKMHIRKLNTFHHRCLRAILGITNRQQWHERITSATVRRRWGNEECIDQMVKRRRLEWLGHIARMPDNRIPKKVFFGWLQQPRPQGGPRRRWKDIIRQDLKDIGIDEGQWYNEAVTSRESWRALCRQSLDKVPDGRAAELFENVVFCQTCSRCFRRESDKKRHKCLDERSKPVHLQKGAIKCMTCNKWFKSKGGLSVHTCRS